MATRKNNLSTDQEERTSLSNENSGREMNNMEENPDSMFVSHDMETEEDLDDDELTEADFAIDDMDEEDEEEEDRD